MIFYYNTIDLSSNSIRLIASNVFHLRFNLSRVYMITNHSYDYEALPRYISPLYRVYRKS